MGSACIAVVEDHEGLRRAIARLLQASGHEVITYASAEAFLGSDDCERPGCLVLDVRLPGLSGFDLRERLSADGPEIPAVYVTAYDDPVARQRAAREGAAFLLKPVEGADLLAAIARALAPHEPRA